MKHVESKSIGSYRNQLTNLATKASLDVFSLKFIDCIVPTRFREAWTRVEASFSPVDIQVGAKKRNTQSIEEQLTDTAKIIA